MLGQTREPDVELHKKYKKKNILFLYIEFKIDKLYF